MASLLSTPTTFNTTKRILQAQHYPRRTTLLHTAAMRSPLAFRSLKGSVRRDWVNSPRRNCGTVWAYKNKGNAGKASEPAFVEVAEDAADSWRLEEIAEIIERGGVGIIPTDTCYAFVCDVHHSKAVDKMYRIKNMDASKPLSILCRNLSDVDTFTAGFPHGSEDAPNAFRIARKCLPGPYTFILQASKELPKRCFDVGGKKQCKFRKCVGVRIPGDPICLSLLSRLHAPLLTTSVPAENWEMQEECIVMSDRYGKLGLDFVVDGGLRVAEPSSVVDLSSGKPVILRRGKGDVTVWDMGSEDNNLSSNLKSAYA